MPLRKPLEYGTLLNALDGIFVAFNSVVVRMDEVVVVEQMQ